MNEVFRGDIDSLDNEAKLVLDKVLGYMEKKYISEPMKLAKEIILKNLVKKLIISAWDSITILKL